MQLLFGIPELDRMLDLTLRSDDAYQQKYKPSRPTSLSILGPDGTGKSVLALHLASRYCAECVYQFKRSKLYAARVLYVSTDLRFDAASSIWSHFDLGRPFLRNIPFERWKHNQQRAESGRGEILINLEPLRPGEGTIVKFLSQTPPTPSVGFIDLASETAGDDWRYTNRILSLLDTPPVTGDKLMVPHLVVIDSVAGFETLVGELDAFGEKSSRRARIAQIMRASRNRCHIVFSVEEPEENKHLPEEFVTDTVIRLRRTVLDGSMRRILEIEKARAKTHATGRHVFEIRDGMGSYTGTDVNPDDPITPRIPGSGTTSYVAIFPSLSHRQSRVAARGEAELTRPDTVADFGVYYLDNLLVEERSDPGIFDSLRTVGPPLVARGISRGMATSLIGEPGTGKSALAESFLCQAFRSWRDAYRATLNYLAGKGDTQRFLRLWHRFSAWTPEGTDRVANAALSAPIKFVSEALEMDQVRAKRVGSLRPIALANSDLRRRYPVNWQQEGESFAATSPHEHIVSWFLAHPAFAQPCIAITTRNVNAEMLAARFSAWLLREDSASTIRSALQEHIRRSIICRRMEIRDQSSAQVFHTIERCVMEAQYMVYGPAIPTKLKDREYNLRIRLVLDDFRACRDMYADLRHDPLFLPFLMFYLNRERVTALIVDTDRGRPDQDPSDEINRDLRALTTQQIYTWPVSFFGESRVAVAVVPSPSQLHQGVIRELIAQRDHSEQGLRQPEVSPNFELYMGLEEGRPQPVPLQIHLYAETPSFETYIEEENRVFNQVFAASKARDGSPQSVIEGIDIAGYRALRDFCSMPIDLQLTSTLVVQLDGYWCLRRDGSMLRLAKYLNRSTTFANGRQDHFADHFGVFQAPPSLRESEKPAKFPRVHYFENRWYKTRIRLFRSNKLDQTVDRVPFTWDFGFLLCKDALWQQFGGETLEQLSRRRGSKIAVCDVWNKLREPAEDGLQQDLPLSPGTSEGGLHLGLRDWRSFFEAARVVADNASATLGSSVVAFDISAVAPDSVSSLVLEIWMSEIYRVQAQGKVDQRFSGVNSKLIDLLFSDVSTDVFSIPEKLDVHEITGNLSLLDLLVGPLDRNNKGSVEEQFAAFAKARRGALPGFTLELYKTWLLLLEVLDFGSFASPDNLFEFRSGRTALPQALCARHWYKTACSASSLAEKTGHRSEFLVPLRLPGYFSTRGDWFLGIVKASRSPRLGERAIDLLSSRRANIRRLQMGLGLPVRDIVEGADIEQFRTALRAPDEKGIMNNLTYGDIVKFGGSHLYNENREAIPLRATGFHWLWRSGLYDYDRHNRPWHRWLNRLFLWTQQYRQLHTQKWSGGFKPYDEIERGDFSNVTTYESFLAFARLVDLLIAELRQAGRRAYRDDSDYR